MLALFVSMTPSWAGLSLYVDDWCWLITRYKSTSGFIIALQGPDSFPVTLWESKTQRAVSRSATEAEFMALSTVLFGGAISLLAVSQRVIASTCVLKVYEDNLAVLAIIAKGFSPKLKHLGNLCRSGHMSWTCFASSLFQSLWLLVCLRSSVTAFWFACGFTLVPTPCTTIIWVLNFNNNYCNCISVCCKPLSAQTCWCN